LQTPSSERIVILPVNERTVRLTSILNMMPRETSYGRPPTQDRQCEAITRRGASDHSKIHGRLALTWIPRNVLPVSGDIRIKIPEYLLHYLRGT